MAAVEREIHEEGWGMAGEGYAMARDDDHVDTWIAGRTPMADSTCLTSTKG